MARILIIDDDIVSAGALARLLGQSGHAVATAATVGAALPHLREEPDLVLLDLVMPEFDGFFVLDAVREEPRLADLNVVIMSGRTDAESVIAAERLGAAGFIPKGLGWDELRPRIERYLPHQPAGPQYVPPEPAPPVTAP